MPSEPILGIDLGGTSIRAGLFRSGGYILKRSERKTPASGGKGAFLKTVYETIGELRAGRFAGIGAGIAGVVDHENGVFLGGPNLPKELEGLKLAALLSRRYGAAAVIENDARCFALAEASLGAGKGLKTVFGMTIGTGIGGGLVRAGELVRGSGGAAGEIGHLPVRNGQDLESLAAGPAVEAAYRRLSRRELRASDIVRAERRGDRHAKKALEAGREALVKGFAAVQLLFDPDAIIVGGGLGAATAYWRPAAASVKKLGFPSLKRIRILPSALGSDAGMIGAALLYEISA